MPRCSILRSPSTTARSLNAPGKIACTLTVRRLKFAFRQARKVLKPMLTPLPSVRTPRPLADRFAAAVSAARPDWWSTPSLFSFPPAPDPILPHSSPNPSTGLPLPARHPVPPQVVNQGDMGHRRTRHAPIPHPRANPARSGASPYARRAAHEANRGGAQQARAGEPWPGTCEC